MAFSESGPKQDFRVTVSLKTVTPHLRSIVPNVHRHMAYFAAHSFAPVSETGASERCFLVKLVSGENGFPAKMGSYIKAQGLTKGFPSTPTTVDHGPS